jgi:beta-mannosidase
MQKHYNVPENFEDFVYVSQLLHAKAYKTAIEAHRRNMPHCMGSLYWQLNDSWPTISWATVDYYGRWKASHYAVREAYKPLMISPVIEGKRFVVYAVSDELQKIDAIIELLICDFYGDHKNEYLKKVEIKPNNSTVIFDIPLDSLFSKGSIIKNMVAGVTLKSNNEILSKNILYFDEPKNLDFPEAELSVSSRKTEQGYELSISSDVLIKNLFLDTPNGNVFFVDNYFDIMPGGTKTIQLVTDSEFDVANDLKYIMLNNL